MKMVEKKMGNFYPVFGKIRLRKNENKVLYPDISKAKKFLNFHPKINLNKIINEVLT